jgi:hypothetical protein
MKEYLKLTVVDTNISYIWNLIFFKDSKLNLIHRKVDKPAVIWNNGGLTYYKDGKIIKYEMK